jgi:iron-sulfur cluster repair protein YtfE (RIC family)
MVMGLANRMQKRIFRQTWKEAKGSYMTNFVVRAFHQMLLEELRKHTKFWP